MRGVLRFKIAKINRRVLRGFRRGRRDTYRYLRKYSQKDSLRGASRPCGSCKGIDAISPAASRSICEGWQRICDCSRRACPEAEGAYERTARPREAYAESGAQPNFLKPELPLCLNSTSGLSSTLQYRTLGLPVSLPVCRKTPIPPHQRHLQDLNL